MYSRQHRTAKTSSDSHDIPAPNQFAPRGFGVQPKTEVATPQQQQTPDLQTQGQEVKQYKSGLIDPSKFTRRSSPSVTPQVQMKLTIGQSGDKYEKEPEIASPIAGDGVIQKMTVGNAAKTSTLSAATNLKHVEPAGTQQSRADAEYGSRTFVTNAGDITGVVDANAHNFESNGQRSARFDFNANVPISQYMKTPPNLGAGQPSVQTINNQQTECEIGVVKTGDDQIQVTHFKKA
jgi:hypothetical protein